MPSDPTFPNVVLLDLSQNPSSIASTRVRMLNRSTGDLVYMRTDKDKLAVYDLANLSNGYSIGQVIEGSVNGAIIGQGTYTVTSGGGTIALITQAVDDQKVSIQIG